MAASMLVPVPLENQLQDPNTDGAPDVNARWNCVPETLAAAGKALVGWRLSGGDLKDAVYGRAYTGATDPARYIPFLGAHAIHMWEVRQSSGAGLVAVAKEELQRGHPVYGAIPSMWGNTTSADIAARGGPTHAIMLCDWSSARGGSLTAMNPWPVDGAHAFYQTMSEAWWASRLVYGHVYPLERLAGGPGPMSTVQAVWSDANGGAYAYPAHEHVPAITLAHAQAFYARAHRVGYSPLRAGYLGSTSYVLWSDFQATIANASDGWQVHLVPGADVLAQVLGDLDGQVAALAAQVAGLKAQQQQQGASLPAATLATIRQYAEGILQAVPA